jgi:adenylate cyclase
MEIPKTRRRLAAILSADVAGYARLVGEDEEGTVARLSTLRRDLIEPRTADHGGRLFKAMGDGFLMEFDSAVEAVRCALAVQRDVGQREAGQAPEQRIALRIGLHLGDVIAEADDLLGDGVNIAARLQAMAEPGDILLSRTIHDQLGDRIEQLVESLGEHSFKNIARPIQVWRIAGTSGESVAAPLPLPERPSIAVLPFANLSGDPAQEYFSDGITEDIITELSRFRDLFVIARNSSFAFRGKAVDVAEIGRRLGVRYLLEGSVRKLGERVRITAQLIDTKNGAHLWAERYDRDLKEIFEVQDEVVATIVATLAGRLQAAGIEQAKRKPPGSLAAYDLLLQGLEQFASFEKGSNERARALFEKATIADPNFGLAYAYLGLVEYVDADWATGAGLDQALAHARKALDLNGDDGRIHRILGAVLLAHRQFDAANHHSERSLQLNPNDANAISARAFLLNCLGLPEEAIEHARRAIRLDPNHPVGHWGTLARPLQATGRYEEALAAHSRIRSPAYHHLANMAACHAHLGHGDEAARLVKRVLELKPDYSARVWVDSRPFKRDEDRERLLADLLKAGLPE